MCINETFLFRTVGGHCVFTDDFVVNLCMLVAGIVILVGNLFVAVTLFRFADMDKSTNSFIANLAAADTCVGVFVVYDVVYNILQFRNYIECVSRIGLFISVNVASVWILGALTCDRYFRLSRPYLYMKCATRSKIRAIEIAIWSLSTAIGLMPFFGWTTLNLWQVCNFFGIMDPNYLLFVASTFFLPFVAMIAAYFRIVRIARGHNSALTKFDREHRPVTNSKRTWKSIRTSCTIVGAFLICWAPVGM